MHFASIEGRTLHYRAEGLAPDRTTVVFVHTLGTDLRIWDQVRADLPPDLATLAYDLRGHGLSDASPTPGGIEDHVSDLAGLLDHLRLPRAVLCGGSMGGLVAQGLCHRHPERVQGLVLSNTGLRLGAAEQWNARIAQVEAEGLAPLAEGLLERWFSPAYLAADATRRRGYANLLARQPASGYVAACAAIRDADLTATAAAIAVPTLCIAGSADQATPPAVVEAMAAAIPGATLTLLEGAGHLPMIEDPGAMAALVAELTARVQGGDTT